MELPSRISKTTSCKALETDQNTDRMRADQPLETTLMEGRRRGPAANVHAKKGVHPGPFFQVFKMRNSAQP